MSNAMTQSEGFIDDGHIENVMGSFDSMIALLNKRAEYLRDSFWAETIAINKTKENKDKGWLGPRVRLRGVSLSITWEIYKSKKKDVKTFAQHIRKSAGSSRYTEKNLRSHAQPWELELAMLYEKQFDEVRKAMRFLVRSRGYLEKYAQLGLIED